MLLSFPCRYVPHEMVGFLLSFGLKTGIDFAYFGLNSGMERSGRPGISPLERLWNGFDSDAALISPYCVPIATLRQNKPFRLLYLGHAKIKRLERLKRP